MPAYMMISVKVHDREKFINQYCAAAAKLVAEYGAEYLFAAPGAELLEGPLEGYSSVTVSKWHDKATALKFWNSPEYAEIKKMREGGVAEAQVSVVEVP